MFGGIRNNFSTIKLKAMNRYFKLSFLFILFLATSCEKETEGISKLTQFASFAMEGDRYMSIIVGQTYTDPGVTAKEGETDLDVKVAGQVDVNTPGVYEIVYSAINKDGFPGSVTRSIAVLPSPELPGVDISGEYNYVDAAGSSEITKVAPGFYITTNVWSPASAMSAYIITTDGVNLTVPLSSLSPFGPLKGTGTISTSGSLVYKIDVINFGIVGRTRNWQKKI